MKKYLLLFSKISYYSLLYSYIIIKNSQEHTRAICILNIIIFFSCSLLNFFLQKVLYEIKKKRIQNYLIIK